MEKIKVSILIPVYNTSEYIEKCTHSILGQTYKNIEYIFVNDCSSDDSVDKLKEVLNQYPFRKKQIKIISHKVNMGLACSRNTAILAATGDYVLHVDSDDYIPLDAVDKLVNAASSTQADIVYGNCVGKYGLKNVNFPQNDSSDVQSYLANVLTRRCMVNIWGKLIRKNLYTEEMLLNKDDSFGEDYLTLPKLIAKSNIIHHLKETIYYYTLNRVGSYSEILNRDKIIKIKKCEDSLKKWFLSQPYYLNYNLNTILELGSYYNKVGIIEHIDISDFVFVKQLYPKSSSFQLLTKIPLKHFVVLILFDAHCWIVLKTLLQVKRAYNSFLNKNY